MVPEFRRKRIERVGVVAFDSTVFNESDSRRHPDNWNLARGVVLIGRESYAAEQRALDHGVDSGVRKTARVRR